MYKRHVFTHEDDDDEMDEDDATEIPTEADMDWQPFENGYTAGNQTLTDVEMTDEGASGNQEIKLRPAVFNPNDEWGLTAYGMKGLDGLFAKGVTLDDIRLDAAKPSDLGRILPYLVYSLMGVTCLCASYVLYNSLPTLSIRW